MAAQTGIKITSDTSEFKKSLEEGKKATKSFRQELREAKKNALDLTKDFRSLSDEMKNSDYGRSLQAQMQGAIQKAGELQDIMDDTTNEIKNFASDTQFADGMRLMTSTVGNLGSALVALTGDSENMKKVLMDIAKIQATVQAVKSLTEAFQKQNRVLLANPYTAVGLVIAGLGTTIYECAKKQDDATISAEKYKKSFEEISTAANIAKMTIYELTQTAANNAKIQDAVSEFTHLGESINELEERQRTLKNWEKWYHRDISKEYAENEKQLQRLKEQQNFQQNLIRKYQGENELIEDAYKKREAAAKKAAEAEKKANTPKPNKPNEFTSTMDVSYVGGKINKPTLTIPKAEVDFSNIEIKGLEVIPNEVQDKYLNAMRLLGEEGQQAFWEAVKNGDSWEDAFKKVTGTFKDLKGKLSEVAAVSNSLSAIFNTLGTSMQAPVFNVLGTIAQSVANIALAYSDAFAKDQTSKSNIFVFIASVAAGLASMVATISQVKKATAFADGGIFKGATTIGDFNLARVNDGEMILNNRQQNNLFDMINSGIDRSDNSMLSGDVEFRLKGTELIGVISNTNKKMKKR